MNYSQGKGRLYPAYSLSGSEGEETSSNAPPSHRSAGGGGGGGGGGRGGYPPSSHPVVPNPYGSGTHKQRSYQQQQQHPLYHVPGSGAGLSDTPTSGNASDETLTDSELTNLARDSTLLVHNVAYSKPCNNFQRLYCDLKCIFSSNVCIGGDGMFNYTCTCTQPEYK